MQTQRGRWVIEHLDAADLPDGIEQPTDADGVYAVFWNGDTPRAQRWFPSSALPLTRSQLASVRLESQLDDPDRHGPAFTTSAIICTRDRPVALVRCLESLLKLTSLPDEVIVVDNASTTPVEIEPRVAEALHVRLIREPRPGLDIARNTGVLASHGEVIAFIDDDVQVHPRWLERIAGPFSDPHVMAVAGLVLPEILDTPSQVCFERRSYLNRGVTPKAFSLTQNVHEGTSGIGAGANLAFRRDAFREGGFDERLDAGAAGVAGDSDMLNRIVQAGHTCVYWPGAVVFHTHRESASELQRQIRAYGRGNLVARLLQTRHDPLRHRLKMICRHYAYHLWNAGVVFRNGPLDRKIALAELRGAAAAPAYYWRVRDNFGVPDLMDRSDGAHD